MFDFVKENTAISGDIKKFNNKLISLRNISNKINHSYSDYDLYNMFIQRGGIVCGGFVLAKIFDKTTKDIDIYFNNEDDFLWAHSMRSGKIDVCFYEESPIEYHDLSFTQIYEKNGVVYTSDDSINTMISSINLNNIIDVDGTVDRILKYNRKYGVKYKMNDVVNFILKFGADPKIINLGVKQN